MHCFCVRIESVSASVHRVPAIMRGDLDLSMLGLLHAIHNTTYTQQY